MKKVVIFSLLFLLLVLSVIAPPPPPPPTPGGAGSTFQVQEQVVVETQEDLGFPTTQNNIPISTGSLETKLASLEGRITKIELDSGIFSIPFIILFGINITLIIIMVYFFILNRSPKEPPFEPPLQQ